jgi:hypothetical protein
VRLEEERGEGDERGEKLEGGEGPGTYPPTDVTFASSLLLQSLFSAMLIPEPESGSAFGSSPLTNPSSDPYPKRPLAELAAHILRLERVLRAAGIGLSDMYSPGSTLYAEALRVWRAAR